MDFSDVDSTSRDVGSDVSETENKDTDFGDGDGVNDFDETYNEMNSGKEKLEYSGESNETGTFDIDNTQKATEVGELGENEKTDETINQSDMTTDESVDDVLSDFDSKSTTDTKDGTEESVSENEGEPNQESDNTREPDNTEEQVEHIQCRNENLEGKEHPETGVPFERRQVEVDGKQYEVVVPQFDSKYDAQLPEDKLKSTDREQFKECNAQLKEEVANNKDLRSQFDDEQIEQIENGDTPDGYTWHHDADVGKMQLVDTEVHQKTGHTGGRSIWGGGTDNR